MYNRYIPQPDGTYRRNRIQEPVREPPRTETQREEAVPEACSPEPEAPPCSNCIHNQPARSPIPPRPRRTTPPVSVGSFLKQLLPKDFDTEDLLIVMLLLLMAGDCHEDQNSALLTLVLYLFM